MRRVIFNQKGGVGKTTITCNLAAVNAAKGRKTLVVDLDPQSNSTQYLLGDAASSVTPNLYHFFHQLLAFRFNRRPVRDFIHPTRFPGLDVFPAQREMDTLHDKLGAKYKIFKMRDALSKLPEYDDVFIDTPAAMNFFSRSALIAADSCLVPFDCDDFSRKALYQLLEDVAEIQEDHNEELAVEGIIVNQYQSRAGLPQRLVGELADEGLPVMKAHLPSSVKVRESHEHACPMVHLAPNHKLTMQFTALWHELQNGIGGEVEILERIRQDEDSGVATGTFWSGPSSLS